MNKMGLKQALYCMWLVLFCVPPVALAEYHMLGDKNSENGETIETYQLSSSANNSNYVLFFQPTQTLSYSGLQREIDVDANNAQYWCKNSASYFTFGTVMDSGAVSAGLSAPDTTYELFRTNVTGLYFSMELTAFRVNGYSDEFIFSRTDIASTSHEQFSLSGGNTNGFNCKLSPAAKGHPHMKVRMRFYTDASFRPTQMMQINAVSSFKVENSRGYGGSMSVNLAISGLIVSLPSCQAVLVNGVNRSTVDLGSYSPAEISAGNTNEIPFTVTLRNCIGIRSIETRLTTNYRSLDLMLLSNNQTGVNGAKGVGVKVMGQPNGVTAQAMQLQPNNSSSVYRDYEDETSTQHYIDGNPGPQNGATQQDLHFTAQLVRDSGQAVKPGDFSATGVFSISYP